MNPNEFPTKGNLMLSRDILNISIQGFGLLDKKRSVLIKEIMELEEKAHDIQNEIDGVFVQAYESLQRASIILGIEGMERFVYGIPKETGVTIHTRSIMGVEIPITHCEDTTKRLPGFGFSETSASLDDAFIHFNNVKECIVKLAALENAAYRLATAIRKTQKRANALKNVTIPKYEALVKSIQETLEERERDDFSRLKVIKSRQ